jgi:hypothetical protein
VARFEHQHAGKRGAHRCEGTLGVGGVEFETGRHSWHNNGPSLPVRGEISSTKVAKS